MKYVGFNCNCGRKQSYAPQNEEGGITEDEAITIGWIKEDSGWVCPFCSGNEDKLKKVFK